jgi:stage III sporulation protein AE
MESNIDEILNQIDFGALENQNVFGGDSFIVKLGKILSGEYASNYQTIVDAVLDLLGGVVVSVLPMIVMIVAIAILSGIMQSIRHEKSGDGVRDIVHFVTYAAIVTIVLYAVVDVTVMTTRTLGAMKDQMDLIFPIILTLMASIGAVSSVSIYQPAIVLLSSGIMQIFNYVIMPIFVITLVFSVVGNLSSSTRYDRFVSFFTSTYKWILGIVFTVFLGFLSIQGITAGTHDGISIRAAKFTMSSYVPFLGGYLSQGFDLIMASSILIKNAVGLAGLLLLLGIALDPVLKITVLMLGLKLAAAITQPLTDSRISNFLTSITKSLSMLLAVIIGAAFMYFVTVGLVIMTGNNIL